MNQPLAPFEDRPVAPGAQSWTARQVVRRTVDVLGKRGLRGAWFGVLGQLGYRRLVLFRATAEARGQGQIER